MLRRSAICASWRTLGGGASVVHRVGEFAAPDGARRKVGPRDPDNVQLEPFDDPAAPDPRRCHVVRPAWTSRKGRWDGCGPTGHAGTPIIGESSYRRGWLWKRGGMAKGKGSVGERATVLRGLSRAPVALAVNGSTYVVDLEPRVSLLDALREHLDLTGTKKGCDQGTCGACTVWVDGRRVLACLTLAAGCEGHEVTTIEGLARDGELHPMQQAFIDHDAFQCGYCTSGQIMSAVALLAEGNAATDADIAEYMSGNICRCAAYPNIRAAIRAVRDGGN
jgi:xanthine dehydrogenase YagT iron-sulfur-binding subunit